MNLRNASSFTERYYPLHKGGMKRLWQRLGAKPRLLELMDAAVLLRIIQATSFMTGKAALRVGFIAEQLNLHPDAVSRSITRLQRAALLVRVPDRYAGGFEFLPNPYLACPRPKEVPRQWAEFLNATNTDDAEETVEPIYKDYKLLLEDGMHMIWDCLVGSQVDACAIKHRDVAVLLRVIDQIDCSTCRAAISVKRISDEIGLFKTQVDESIGRLKRASLLVSEDDYASGRRQFIVNPLLSAVNPDQQQRLMPIFCEIASSQVGDIATTINKASELSTAPTQPLKRRRKAPGTSRPVRAA